MVDEKEKKVSESLKTNEEFYNKVLEVFDTESLALNSAMKKSKGGDGAFFSKPTNLSTLLNADPILFTAFVIHSLSTGAYRKDALRQISNTITQYAIAELQEMGVHKMFYSNFQDKISMSLMVNLNNTVDKSLALFEEITKVVRKYGKIKI